MRRFDRVIQVRPPSRVTEKATQRERPFSLGGRVPTVAAITSSRPESQGRSNRAATRSGIAIVTRLQPSGGLQEEAPSLGKPVLVLREVNKREEGLEAGACRLLGTDDERIVAEASDLLSSPSAPARMSRAGNPYDDGKAAKRFVNALRGVAVDEWHPALATVEQDAAWAIACRTRRLATTGHARRARAGSSSKRTATGRRLTSRRRTRCRFESWPDARGRSRAALAVVADPIGPVSSLSSSESSGGASSVRSRARFPGFSESRADGCKAVLSTLDSCGATS